MNLVIENYAQIATIAIPVLTLAAMNVFLALGGERGTLLLPSANPFDMATQRRTANTVPASAPAEATELAANDPDFRRIA